MFSYLSSNPLIGWEFLRFLRRGRSFILLGFVLLVCTGAICTAWKPEFESEYPVGRFLFFSMLTGESIAILLLLPGMIAHSLITERDRDTLPLLLMTPLGEGKIIFGKMLSVLGGIFLLVFSTFPMISICMVRGGVSPIEILGGMALIIYIGWVTACLASFHALSAATTFRAVLLTYFSLFVGYGMGGAVVAFGSGVLFGFLSVIERMLRSKGNLFLSNFSFFLWIPVSFYIGITTVAAGYLLLAARNRLRWSETRIRFADEMQRHPAYQFRQEQNTGESYTQSAALWHLEDGQNPYYLRERIGFFAGHSPFSLPSWYFLAVLSHFVFLGVFIEHGIYVVMLVWLGIVLMTPAFTVILFTGEREKGTWDLLLASTCDFRALLHGKWLAIFYQCGTRTAGLFFPPFLLAYAAAFGIQRFLPISVSLPFNFGYFGVYILLLSTQVIFLIFFSTLVSLLSSKISEGLLWSYGIISFYTAVSFLAPEVWWKVFQSRSDVVTAFAGWVNPLVLLSRLLQRQTFPEFYINHLLGYFVLYAVLSTLLYFYIRRRHNIEK